ncbi:MAG: hypothetical protein NWF04_06300 [Candidatus Bathyarchaeota archaeon]|nr:hypothetical protein [Candidatus Bathyarchaeota archaeon]
MTDWVKRALTRRSSRSTACRPETVPSERLVVGVKFAVVMTASLTVLEVAHLALIGTWNSEVFASITGLIGTITGVIISQRTD